MWNRPTDEEEKEAKGFSYTRSSMETYQILPEKGDHKRHRPKQNEDGAPLPVEQVHIRKKQRKTPTATATETVTQEQVSHVEATVERVSYEVEHTGGCIYKCRGYEFESLKSNMVYVCSMACPLNLDKIARELSLKLNARAVPAINIPLKSPKTTGMGYHGGQFTCVGAEIPAAARLAVHTIALTLCEAGYPALPVNLKLVNIACSVKPIFDAKSEMPPIRIDLQKFAAHEEYGPYILYETNIEMARFRSDTRTTLVRHTHTHTHTHVTTFLPNPF